MVLSQREKYIAIATAAVLLLFVLYNFVLTPVMDAGDRIGSEKGRLLTKLEQAQRIFDRRDQVTAQWGEMKAGGLGTDPSAIESRVLNAVRQWSEDCRLPISTVKPDRDKGDGDLRKIFFNLALTGDMESVVRFLWEVENCELPLRVKEFQLGSRGADGSALSLQIKLSALYLGNDPDGQATTEVN
jgi:hypothetical protein